MTKGTESSVTEQPLYKIHLPINPAGHYTIGENPGFTFPIGPKPSWLNRWMMKRFFGIRWRDN